MPRQYTIDIDSYIGYPISAAYIKSKLLPHKGRPVTVRINSYGGDVMTALDIRQQFIDHGSVTAYIMGMTASAATILAMGAKRVVMSRYALLLVHPASAGITELGMYNHDQLEEAIQRLRHQQTTLDNIDSVLASIYADHSAGRATPEQMATLMREARWLTAEEALAAGLIDAIDEDQSTAPTDKPEDQPSPLLTRLRALIHALFSTPQQSTPTNPTTMNNTHILALLKAEAPTPAADGTITLTPEQITALDTAINDLQTNLATTEAARKEAETARINAESELAAINAADGATSDPLQPTAQDEQPAIPGIEAANFYHRFSSVI